MRRIAVLFWLGVLSTVCCGCGWHTELDWMIQLENRPMGLKRDLATCLSCNHKQMVNHREWIRASRPRCVACGGAMEKSAAAHDDEKRHQGMKQDSDAMRDEKTNSRKTYRKHL